MAEIDELLAALTSEAADGQDSFELDTRTLQFIRTGPPADVARLLDVVDRPLALPDTGPFMPPASTIILSVVARFPAPALVPKLVELSYSCAARERLQIVRSLFEIGVRADDQAAVEAGLQVAGRFAVDRVPVGVADPLYWLRREPVHPDIVIPHLVELARHEGWRDEAEATRVAYLAAFPDLVPVSSAYSLEELRAWAQHRDERLLSVVLQHAANASDDIVAVQALPAVLRIPLLVSTVEGEILNGGYLQYFWNHGRPEAVAAGDALDALRWAEFAQVHRDALAAYDQAEAQLVRLQTEDTLTAYSSAAELGVFDAAEHRFMQLYDLGTVADGLLDWLSTRVDQVAAAIGVPTGSNPPPA